MASKILKIAAHGVFAARGWTFEPLPADWQPKQVIIGFPHTTWTDTLMAFSGFAIVEQKGLLDEGPLQRRGSRWN